MHDASGDSDMNDSIDNMTHDDIFLPAAMQPQVTINESPRFDAPNVANVTAVKREGNDGVVISRPQSPTALYRSTYSKSSFNFPCKFSEIFSFSFRTYRQLQLYAKFFIPILSRLFLQWPINQ